MSFRVVLCRHMSPVSLQKMMKNRVTPEHESSSVESSSGSAQISFMRKASTVVPASDSGLVVREAGASSLESANSQISDESSEVASATLRGQVGSENAAIPVESAANWKYHKGDTVKYQNGKIAYTVRASLGRGAFGEVYKVWSEVQQKLRAMKCTRFGVMPSEERRKKFQSMCEEALIMMELRHHPNIISIRYVKVSGLDFLVIMDYIHGSQELSQAYQNGSIWDPERPPSSKTIPQTTSLLSLLWFQLAHAIDHLHRINIMVCITCSSAFFSFF